MVIDLLRQFTPKGRPQLLAALADGWSKLVAVGIATPLSPLTSLRVAHFMAQIATETGGFTIFEENMNYSAQRMCQVWPSRFHSIAEAMPFAHNPEKLANNVYGGRMGNVHPDDGWRYHGRGFMQTTGRDNYTRIGHADDPERLIEPAVALDAALEEWTRGHLNAVADNDDLTRIRKVINGGLIGIENARIYLARAKRIFTADALSALGDHLGSVSPISEIPPPISEIDILVVQTRLKALGFDPGPLDGDRGDETNKALEAYAINELTKKE